MMQGLDKKGWKNVLKQALNLGLGSSNSTETTSYNGSFDIDISDRGFAFIPRIPASYLIDDDLYEQIFKIVNVIVYPYYTVVKRPMMNLVKWKSNDFHSQRALWFDWTPVNQRAKITRNYMHLNNTHSIPVMTHFFVDFDSVTSILIAGNSGSGKSYFLSYLLDTLHMKHKASDRISELFVIDPKKDSPARWCKAMNVDCVYPSGSGATADFVANQSDDRLRYIFLCHLSNDNNTPEIARHEVCAALEAKGRATTDGEGLPDANSNKVTVVALPRFDTSRRYVLRKSTGNPAPTSHPQNPQKTSHP